jgi:hypothetical protein
LEWATIITIVLGSSFLGAVLTNVAGWLIKRSDRSSQATYLALNIAHLFEKYSYECLSISDEHDTARSSGGHAGSYITKILQFPKLPEFDYRVLDPKILDKIFDFPQQVCFASDSLASAFEFLDGEDAIEGGYKDCLKLAKESLNIADDVRQKYKLEKRSLEFENYSVRARINEKINNIKK